MSTEKIHAPISGGTGASQPANEEIQKHVDYVTY